VEHVKIKEEVNIEILSVTSLEKMEEEPIVNQDMKLVESIQRLQQRFMN